MNESLKRKAVRAGGRRLAKRLLKPIPFVGAAVAVGLAGYEMRRKGAWRGALHVGLDMLPVVGTVKDVVEIFTGDLIPDKKTARG